MKNPSVSLFSIEDRYNSENIVEELNEYTDRRQTSEVEETLLTTFSEVTSTDRGASFILEFDYIEEISVREESTPNKHRAMEEVKGRFVKGIVNGHDGFLLYGSDPDEVAGPVAKALTGEISQYRKIELKPNLIAKIIDKDSNESKYKTWEDVDLFTHMASLKGDIEESTYYTDFNDKGRPVWAMYKSEQTSHTVGVSSAGIVLYGDVAPSDVEDYYFEIVKSVINTPYP